MLAPIRLVACLGPLALVVASAASAGCEAKTATPEECDKVADHLADLKVAQEKQPKVVQSNGTVRGGLLLPPFGDAAKEKEVRDEARGTFKDRCAKGWKRATWDCMMAAKDLEAAELCRVKQQQ
jgi:hypothetical protein